MNKKLNSLALAITLALSANAQVQAAPVPVISLEAIGTHTTGIFDEGAAEIVAHDARNQRIFKINANAAAVEVLDINDPENPGLIGTIDASALGAGANSVAIYKDLVAVAIEAEV
ncbi:MAG: alkaline phosphatase, partial [Chromatiales bacterium]